MKWIIALACLGLSLTGSPAVAQFHPEARRAYEEHWRAHPEHPEDLVRRWHKRLFHREIEAPFLGRWVAELKRGVEAPLALSHILGSPEYYVTVGSTPEGFIRRTFVEVVGRPPTESEFQFWLRRLYHEGRAEVAYEMVTRYPPAWVVEEPPVVEKYEYRRPVLHYHP
jgi:hypothetical protein